MTKLKHSIFFITFSLLMTSCGSNDTIDDVALTTENNIYQQYTIEYHESTHDISINAQLRVGGPTGTTVHITEPASLKVNNQNMNFVDGNKQFLNLTGSWYYFEERAENNFKPYEISWNRHDSISLKTTLTHIPASHISGEHRNEIISVFSDTNFYINNEYFEIDKTAKQTEETLTCHIKSLHRSYNDQRLNDIYAYSTDLSHCTFSAEKMRQLIPGEAEVRVIRRVMMTYDTDKNTKGRSVTKLYESSPIPISIPQH